MFSLYHESSGRWLLLGFIDLGACVFSQLSMFLALSNVPVWSWSLGTRFFSLRIFYLILSCGFDAIFILIFTLYLHAIFYIFLLYYSYSFPIFTLFHRVMQYPGAILDLTSGPPSLIARGILQIQISCLFYYYYFSIIFFLLFSSFFFGFHPISFTYMAFASIFCFGSSRGFYLGLR